MSLFAVSVVRLDSVEPHPDADRLDVARIGGFCAVVQKGLHAAGDAVVYIPEDAIIPAPMASALGIGSYLVGKNNDRVKTLRLRGVLSQGIVLPMAVVCIALSAAEPFQIGADLTTHLGITKYEAIVPVHMEGVARSWPSFIPYYDIENIKRPEWFGIFQPGEPVSITEKLHGANCCVAIGPGLDDGEEAFVCSHNVALKEQDDNVYWRAVRKYALIDRLQRWMNLREAMGRGPIQSVALFGEVLGVQHLRYGHRADLPGFAAFDLMVDGEYLPPDEFQRVTDGLRIPGVPWLYSGPFDYTALDALAEADSAYGGIREGVVIKPAVERRDPKLGRVVLKYVGARYLLSKGRTDGH